MDIRKAVITAAGPGQRTLPLQTLVDRNGKTKTALSEVKTQFVAVPRFRGQQLKDQAQLDGWLRDGSADYMNGLCAWA
jgi:hypothetical protein